MEKVLCVFRDEEDNFPDRVLWIEFNDAKDLYRQERQCERQLTNEIAGYPCKFRLVHQEFEEIKTFHSEATP